MSQVQGAVVELSAEQWGQMTPHERKLIQKIVDRVGVTQNVNVAYDQTTSFGDRLADRVAEVGGSWGFVVGFAIVIAAWALLNVALLPMADRFDPYPFIFMNLLLSMLAAVQAPIIMMSQNRASARDRLDAQLDYEVNLRAELEVAQLHDKIDRLTHMMTEGQADSISSQPSA